MSSENMIVLSWCLGSDNLFLPTTVIGLGIMVLFLGLVG